MSTATPVRPGTSPAAKLVSHVATARESGIVLALVLIIVVATLNNPTFLFSSDGFRDLLLTPSLLLLVAVGQAIVIITRNVDLSVGSVVGLTAYLTGGCSSTCRVFPSSSSSSPASWWAASWASSTVPWSPTPRCPHW